MNFHRLIVSSVAILALAGCSAMEQANRTAAQVDRDVVSVTAIAKAAQTQHPRVERAQVMFHEGSWASLVPMEIKQREARAKLLCMGKDRVSYSPRPAVDILEFSQFITNLCGIPIRVMPDAIAAIQAQGRATTSGVPGTPSAPIGAPISPMIPSIGAPIPAMGMPATIAAGQGQVLNGIGGRSGLIDIKYDGDFPGLIDTVTNRLGVSWRITDGAISIFYVDTKTFRLFSQPYAYDLQSVVQSGTTTTTGVSSGGSGASGGISGTSGSQQSSTITMKSSRWDDIDKTVKQMLTPNVGRAQGSPSTGTYTVTDIPEVLERVGVYFDTENKSLTKQIVFTVKVLAVTLTDSNGLGIDWTMIYRSLNGNWGFKLSNITQKDTSAISGTVNVLSPASGSPSQFAGTSAVISALAQQGRVSELMSPSVTTLNHHTVPVQIGSQISYIAGSQTVSTPQVGSTTSLTMGTLTTGFNMRLTPYVMPDDQMLLDAAINVSSLRRLRPVGTATSPAEAPDLDNRIFSQTARLRAGETMILSGFEQINDTSNKAGVGDPSNIVFGGSVQSSTNRSVVVILITPMLMD